MPTVQMPDYVLLHSGVYCSVVAAVSCAAILLQCTALVIHLVHALMQLCFRNDTAHNSNPDASSPSQ